MPENTQTSDRTPKRLNFSTYSQDYFTGSQVKVYFGAIYVDDVATIQYQTSHSKTPLYGYCDHKFRAVAKGQFIVNGTFTIAFKETGYLNQIISLIRNDNVEINKILEKSSPFAEDQMKTFIEYINRGLTPEQAVDAAASVDRSRTVGGGRPTSDLEDIVEVMEDTIWGKEGSEATYGRRIPRSDELDYFKYTKNISSNDIDVEGFDILLTFGDYRSGKDTPEHTMISITDVHIVGESLIATPAGDPIGISYQFFANGLNEKVSAAWPIADKKVELKPESIPTPEEQKVREKIIPNNESTTNATNVTDQISPPVSFVNKDLDLVPTIQPKSNIYDPSLVPITYPTKITRMIPPQTSTAKNFKIKGNITDTLQTAKIRARQGIGYKLWNVKVEIKGDSRRGILEGEDVYGTYEVYDKMIHIDIPKIPWWAPRFIVNSRLEKFFS